MTATPDRAEPSLRPAVVLSTEEDACTVFADGRRAVVPYANPFPRPRSERVAPGHLVALATVGGGFEVVVWRWFDAIVQDAAGPVVCLWEPTHGSVRAEPRNPQQVYQPGSRAYLSAGLPGAQWWVAGPVLERAEDADLDLDEVERFFTSRGLWDSLT